MYGFDLVGICCRRCLPTRDRKKGDAPGFRRNFECTDTKRRRMVYELRPLAYSHVKNGSVYGVYRKSSGGPPVFVVAPSAALLRKGLHQLGLYAGVDLPSNASLGRYEGDVLGTFRTAAEASRSDVAEREDKRGNTMMLVRKNRTGEFELVDGTHAPPPYLSLCNDPRGTRLAQNLRATEFGGMYTTCRVPAFDVNATLYANANAELLWDYGSTFWRNVQPAAATRRRANCTRHDGQPGRPYRGGGATQGATPRDRPKRCACDAAGNPRPVRRRGVAAPKGGRGEANRDVRADGGGDHSHARLRSRHAAV